jgi:hypothetical protein
MTSDPTKPPSKWNKLGWPEFVIGGVTLLLFFAWEYWVLHGGLAR